MQYTSKLVFRA